jgi:drug/metabolite transporter (DMT)-like permease
MQRNDTFTSSIVVIASAFFFYLIYNVKSGFFIPVQSTAWMNMIAISVVSTVIAIFTYFQGMKLSGAVNASMLSTFEPVTTMVLSFIFLGQMIGPLQMTGAALILSSALIVAVRGK